MIDAIPYRTVPRNVSLPGCATLCRTDPACASLNVDTRKGSCELYSETASLTSGGSGGGNSSSSTMTTLTSGPPYSFTPPGIQGGFTGSTPGTPPPPTAVGQVHKPRRLIPKPHYSYMEKTCYDASTRDNSIPQLDEFGNALERSKQVLRAADLCAGRQWSFERVPGRELVGIPHGKIYVDVTTREECEMACLEYSDFVCRSAEWNPGARLCRLSPYNRYSSADKRATLEASMVGVDYLENNCARGESSALWESNERNKIAEREISMRWSRRERETKVNTNYSHAMCVQVR